MFRKRALIGLVVAAVAVVGIVVAGIAGAAPLSHASATRDSSAVWSGLGDKTQTPIKHVVVIFQENVSFDHYFGTYPRASNEDGSPFSPRPGTPAVNGLTPATALSIPSALRHSSDLLNPTVNPNIDPPLRLDSSAIGLPGDAGGQLTCDQDHNYSDEQQATD